MPESRRSTESKVTFSLVAMTVATGCSCFPCKQMMIIISLCFCNKTALYMITGKSVHPAIRDTQLFATKTECDGLIESFWGLSFGYCWYYYPDLYYICHIRYYRINNAIHCTILCKWHVGRYLWKAAGENCLHIINEHLNITAFLSDHHTRITKL